MTFTIERLGHLGDGLTADGLRAARMLPGEVIEAQQDGMQLLAPKIITPSEHRVKPSCRHYNSCGGCALQHATDDFLKTWKTDIVTRALRAHEIETEVNLLHVSPPNSRRRAKLTATRTKSGVIIGFNSRASETVVHTPECKLLTPAILAAWPFFEDLARRACSRKGKAELHVTDCTTGLDVAVSGGKALEPKEQAELARVASAAGVLRLFWNDELISQEAAPTIDIDGQAVPFPSGAFLQATSPAQEAMISEVLRQLDGASQVVDLFSGLGTFSLPIARFASVVAVEGERSLLDALDAAWRRSTGLRTIKCLQRDLFRSPLSGDDFYGVDAVVIDPPRAGAELQFEALGQSSVSKIVTVSCNPVTFARDVQLLVKAGFHLGPVQVIDQFRWSPHVEVITTLTR